ncbi:MAG: hypothetical protein WBH71_06910 [Bacteroidales bacterium]|nr:hypothetical protein [Bacteroidales bacterium]MDI9592074.1 hypothetical protein [Bacteroidota bacterium]NLH34088.1 hypothetical protein [Lentimicrobium sp.]OQC37523.1 MAG: hypothetical protein BWX63_01010 [Bacteroidetes bacterium ADurb.Bin041]MBP7874100.1 hypothetical protein [Bacteroidales bacterium]
MKKILRTAALFLLATIYCFAMNVVTQSIVSFNYNSDVHSGEERYLERVYSIFFYHTPHNETASNTVQNFVAHEFKNLFHFIWATQETIENKFEKSFTLYTWNSENIQIRYRKTNLIFPFHNFW